MTHNDPLILAGGTVVDVLRRRLHRADVFVRDGRIAGVGRAPAGFPTDAATLDVRGRFVAPGFIDPHLHIESSLLAPLAFAPAAVAHGTTAVFVDPHEIANVCGRAGIGLFLRQAPLLPLDLYVGVPSCVPATALEDAGAAIGADDVRELLAHPRVYGLAEMMNFPAILAGFGEAREKVELALAAGKLVDGHAPGLHGNALRRYVGNGRDDGAVRIMSDHECTTAEEALEKRRTGMQVALRHGSASKDLPRILPGLLRMGLGTGEGFMLCSDDLDPVELRDEGHMDRAVRAARTILIAHGRHPDRAAIDAIALATLQPGRYFAPFLRGQGLAPLGAVAPGYRANLTVLRSLERIDAVLVLQGGRAVHGAGAASPEPGFDYAPYAHAVRLGRTFRAEDFTLRHDGPDGTGEAWAIGLTEGIRTVRRRVPATVRGGVVERPAGTAKIAVIERHHATGRYAVGLVERCLDRGAVAGTIAHDSHNLVVVGVDDAAMATAANWLQSHGGGMVAVDGGVRAHLHLPVAGLMSPAPLAVVARGYEALRAAVQALGGRPDLPMRMSFLALPVIPELRITNRGLVDVERFDFLPLVA